MGERDPSSLRYIELSSDSGFKIFKSFVTPMELILNSVWANYGEFTLGRDVNLVGMANYKKNSTNELDATTEANLSGGRVIKKAIVHWKMQNLITYRDYHRFIYYEMALNDKVGKNDPDPEDRVLMFHVILVKSLPKYAPHCRTCSLCFSKI
ncbi:uncharacterized protein LOC141855926 [Brevipalpus obovatus]|uniref:uncharacterized protein LOC141855926 n=1 Tax=Brevipalpus obovatus TaxID=246614 RepID=UPI003D9E9AD0